MRTSKAQKEILRELERGKMLRSIVWKGSQTYEWRPWPSTVSYRDVEKLLELGLVHKTVSNNKGVIELTESGREYLHNSHKR